MTQDETDIGQSQPLVSVIVPAYQVEDYLGCCLDSILEQTYKNIEVIVVNDASSDDTGRIALAYAQREPLVKAINKEVNEGTNRARQTGLAKSTGSLIAFVDGDDILAPNYIAELADLLESNQADISICAFQEFYDEEKIDKVNHPSPVYTYDQKEAVYYFLTYELYWPHEECALNNLCNKLIIRSVVEQIDWDVCDYSIGEDDFCTAMMIRCAQRIAVTEQKLYWHRKSNPNAKTVSGQRPFLFQNQPYSVFRLCNDFYILLQQLFGEELHDEVVLRAHIIYRYYSWNVIQVKRAFSREDIEEFDRYFPLREIKSVSKHAMDPIFITRVSEQGLVGWVNHILAHNGAVLADKDEQIDWLTAKVDELTAEISRLSAEVESTMSIRGSLRRLSENIRRRITRGSS